MTPSQNTTVKVDLVLRCIQDFEEYYYKLEKEAQTHSDEVGIFGDKELDLDIEQYALGCKNGHYLFLVLEDESTSDILGYIGMNAYRHSMYRDMKIANQDFFYLKPKCRGKGISKIFLEMVHDFLKQVGIDRVYQHSPIDKPRVGLYESLGYTQEEITFSKDL